MSSLVRHLLIAAAAASLTVTARAQQPTADSTALPPVVITATRVGLPQAAPTVSTTVITGDALRAQGITTVQDALDEAPDIFVPRSGSYGAQTSLFVRGGNSDYTQVLVDGVPVNDPGGAIDLANLSTDNVDRIEIVRGPASVLYGANAVSGVIQIFTRDGAAGWHASASARGGTYDSRDVEASLLGGGRHLSGSLALGDHRSDGIYAFNNGNRNSVASGALRLTPDARSSVRLALRYGDARADIPTNFYGVADDSNQFHTERRWIGSVDAGRFLTPRLEARVLLGATQSTGRSADLPDTAGETCDACYDNTTTTSRRSADARLNLHVAPELLLTTGGAYEWQHERITGSSADSRTVNAFYAQALGSAWRAFSYTAGVRRDDNSLFGSFTTFRVSTGYALREGTHVHASFGTAFKEPTFDQMLSTSPFARGNPALRPEHTRSWDAGLSQTLVHGVVTIGATYFSQRFRDMIQYLASPPEAEDPNYVNLGGVRADGVEYTAALH
ncbi:MAG: TonB-dependent receptor plug domain-containing protein, partial [Gemmatimonadaceae bacterium]